VVASAAKAKLGALLLTCQERIIIHLTLEDLGHPQPKIPVHSNNAKAIGITNNTIKWQSSWDGNEIFLDMWKRCPRCVFF
jgi:hypothetical protein